MAIHIYKFLFYMINNMELFLLLMDVYLSSVYLLCIIIFYTKYDGFTIFYLISSMFHFYSTDMAWKNSIWTVYWIDHLSICRILSFVLIVYEFCIVFGSAGAILGECFDVVTSTRGVAVVTFEFGHESHDSAAATAIGLLFDDILISFYVIFNVLSSIFTFEVLKYLNNICIEHILPKWTMMIECFVKVCNGMVSFFAIVVIFSFLILSSIVVSLFVNGIIFFTFFAMEMFCLCGNGESCCIVALVFEYCSCSPCTIVSDVCFVKSSVSTMYLQILVPTCYFLAVFGRFFNTMF